MVVDIGRFARKMFAKMFSCLFALVVTFLTMFVLVILSTALGAYGATFFLGNALIYYWLMYGAFSILVIGGAYNGIIRMLCQPN